MKKKDPKPPKKKCLQCGEEDCPSAHTPYVALSEEEARWNLIRAMNDNSGNDPV